MTPKTPAPAKRSLFAPEPNRQETGKAAQALDRELRAAGLRSIMPVLDDERGVPYVRLDGANAVDAAELARLLRKAMRGAYRVASQLREVAHAHGLGDFPDPAVYDAKIYLGDISIHTADRLACILGAPPQPELADSPDRPEAQQVLDRLGTAFKKATDGGFLDMYFHPYCQRCEGEPAIGLGDLTVRTARRLVTALKYGA